MCIRFRHWRYFKLAFLTLVLAMALMSMFSMSRSSLLVLVLMPWEGFRQQPISIWILGRSYLNATSCTIVYTCACTCECICWKHYSGQARCSSVQASLEKQDVRVNFWNAFGCLTWIWDAFGPSSKIKLLFGFSTMKFKLRCTLSLFSLQSWCRHKIYPAPVAT